MNFFFFFFFMELASTSSSSLFQRNACTCVSFSFCSLQAIAFDGWTWTQIFASTTTLHQKFCKIHGTSNNAGFLMGPMKLLDTHTYSSLTTTFFFFLIINKSKPKFTYHHSIANKKKVVSISNVFFFLPIASLFQYQVYEQVAFYLLEAACKDIDIHFKQVQFVSFPFGLWFIWKCFMQLFQRHDIFDILIKKESRQKKKKKEEGNTKRITDYYIFTWEPLAQLTIIYISMSCFNACEAK